MASVLEELTESPPAPLEHPRETARENSAVTEPARPTVCEGRPAWPISGLDRSFWVMAGVVSLLIAVVYGPSVGYGFVNWDDPWYVIHNPLIQGWSLENLWGIATEVVTRNYAPVTIFSYLLDHTLWGLWPGGYHLTNLLWHALNSLLVFLLVRQVTGRTHWAWPTALLFAIHPVHIESVVWISARKGLLSTAFMLVSLLFWLKRKRTAGDELWGTLFFLLALFSKAVAVVLPAIVLMYDWLVRRKSLAESFSRQFIGLLVALWFTLLTKGAQNTVGGGVRHHFDLNPLQILGVDSLLLWQYLRMLVWPVERSVLYDPPIEGLLLPMLLSAVVWGLAGWWLWRQRTRYPLFVFALLSAGVCLAPVLNFIPLTTLINDRYLYLPSIPLFAVAVAGVDLWLARIRQSLSPQLTAEQTTSPTEPWQQWSQSGRKIQATLWGLALLGCGWLTTQQLPMWRSDLDLWNHTVQVNPTLPIVHYQHALALWEAGQKQQALEKIDHALQLPRLDEFDRERFLKKREKYIKELRVES